MNISLTPQLEQAIQNKVDSGYYNNASEVVRESLRMMLEHERKEQFKLEALREEIRRGLDSGFVEGKAAMKNIRKKLEEKIGQ
jgi:antitoxin ParD1/3/4